MRETPKLTYIKELSGGDLEFENRLLSVIDKEFPFEKETYYKNLKDKNYQKVAENVHKLKHKINILGLEKSYAIAVAYENDLKENNDELKNEFEDILKTITTYLNQL
ncbi:Hpt domain-containing protein [Geojedonia litorea]|uniref:Hpt domain-containing protein n=1 Tax=Geojedonia litorea TaxID=1268269 RepID=A0ABV9N9J0_9FLAO